MNAKEQEKQEAIEELKKFIKPGDTVFTVLRHVSRSGMSRAIDLYVMQDNEPWRISWTAAKLLEGYDKTHEARKAGGCGMDMGFHLVYTLSRILFRDNYFCTGEGCSSNDHVNRDTHPEGTCLDHVKRENGVCKNKNCKPWKHSDAGYALKQKWM